MKGLKMSNQVPSPSNPQQTTTNQTTSNEVQRIEVDIFSPILEPIWESIVAIVKFFLVVTVGTMLLAIVPTPFMFLYLCLTGQGEPEYIIAAWTFVVIVGIIIYTWHKTRRQT
jgi:hypothetical protein